MSAGLPASLAQSFRLAAAELGMCTTAWLFVEEIAAAGGESLLAQLRDALGRAYPVLDTVIAAYLDGERGPDTRTAGIEAACEGARKLVVVGIEARFLDAIVRALPDLPIYLVSESVLLPDWQRVAANYDGRVELVNLHGFQRHAGPRSVLLTCTYGRNATSAHVMPAWARVFGSDVRTQFRQLVGWEVLRRPFYVYPRWLVEVSTEQFTHLVGA